MTHSRDTSALIATPEHDKLIALEDRRTEIQTFLDWLGDKRTASDSPETYRICRYWPKEPNEYGPLGDVTRFGNAAAWHPDDGENVRERLMAGYFGIDLDALREEKEAMYRALAAMHREDPPDA